jgi:hypothetical protein
MRPLGVVVLYVRLQHPFEMSVARNAEDKERRLNRTENVRPIPPSDPDFDALYARRNDAESINRGLHDSLYFGRAHSRGQLRQQVELLAYAIVVNSIAISEHRRRRAAARAA